MADLDPMYVPPTQVEWLPPPNGTIKLNFDGGLSRQRGCAVSAGIFRDHLGVPVVSYAYAHPGITGLTSYDGEAEALYLGLNIAFDHRFKSLWVEGDAKLLIDVARGKRPDISNMYNQDTITRIKNLLTLFRFEFREEPELTFIPREGNMAADSLVRHMADDHVLVSTKLHRTWEQHEKLPDKVTEIVNQERNGCAYVREGRYVRRPPTCFVPSPTYYML